MALYIVLLLLGLALVVFGADWLVDGASGIARKIGLSEFVIGLTIVGMGTSAPEMVVSFVGAFEGNSAISAGNIIGSNIFNTLLILGITAMILPIYMTPENRRKDIPMNIAISALAIILGMKATLMPHIASALGWTNTLGRIDGAIMLLIFILYIGYALKKGMQKQSEDEGSEEVVEPQMGTFKAILLVVVGLACLVIGGRLFVNNATSLARLIGVSDKFIAITILAAGTSLPELATCVVAAAKKKGQLALGNLLGSNIFNVLLILGGSALIHPVSFAAITWWDLGIFFLGSILVWLSAYTERNNKIDRLDGTMMILAEIAYMIYLFMHL